MDSGVNESQFMIPTNGSDTAMVLSQKPTLLNDLAEFLFRLIFFVILSSCISMFGIVANIINIVVFIRQGIFSDGSNLNLFFLALMDLGCVATNLLHSIGFSIILADIPDLSWDVFAVVYLGVGVPTSIFMLGNRYMTAYIAFERCMCVMLPFRVKTLFAPRRSLVYILIILAYPFLSHIPFYLTYRLEFQMQEETNTSKLVIALTSESDIVFDVLDYVNYLGMSIGAVIIVFICTAITSSHIKTSKKWRQSVTKTNVVNLPTDQANSTTTTTLDVKETTGENAGKDHKLTNSAIDKETRLVKMITLISIIFLICYTPECVLIIMKAVDGRISATGQYYRLASFMYSIVFVTASTNASINIIVYYNMSSRYRKEFKKWCR